MGGGTAGECNCWGTFTVPLHFSILSSLQLTITWSFFLVVIAFLPQLRGYFFASVAVAQMCQSQYNRLSRSSSKWTTETDDSGGREVLSYPGCMSLQDAKVHRCHENGNNYAQTASHQTPGDSGQTSIYMYLVMQSRYTCQLIHIHLLINPSTLKSLG